MTKAAFQLISAMAFMLALCAYSHADTLEEAVEGDVEWHKNKGIVVIVGDPYVNLYTHPGRGYPKFHVLEKYEKLRIYKSRTDWYKAETEDGKISWVRRRDLKTSYDENGAPLDFSIPAWDAREAPWQMGLMAGTVDGAIAYTLFAGYRFTSNFTGELKFTQAFGDFSNVKLGSINLLHQPFPGWRASPFFLMGAGRIRTFPATVLVESEDREDSTLTVGGGLMFYANHKLALRLEYNKHVVLTTRVNNQEVEEWKAGFSVLF